MSKKPTHLLPGRLRGIDERRLIEKPLSVERSVIRGPWRKRPGLAVWLAALLAVLLFFALSL